MFTLWAISCAPLYLGSHLTHMDPADLTLISNHDLIGIDQAGTPARPLDLQHLRGKPQQAWLTTYADGSAVLTLFNLGPTSATVKVSWSEIDALRDTRLSSQFSALKPPSLRDLVSGADIPTEPGGLAVILDSHASRIVRLPAPH